MIGLLELVPRQRGRKSVVLTERKICGARFLCASVAETPALTRRARVERAVRRLEQAGATALLPPAGLAVPDRLPVVDTLPLARELAADLVLRQLADRGIPPGRARVGVGVREVTAEAAAIVTALALRCRYLCLEADWGGEALCRRLWRDHGVAVEQGLAGADAVVLLDPPEGEIPNVLGLYPGGSWSLPPLTAPPELEARLPGPWDKTLLLAALRQMGAVPRGSITLAEQGRDKKRERDIL